MFQNKDRAIYYLERTIEAYNRELSGLTKEKDGFESNQNRQYAQQIDQGEASVKRATEDEAAAKSELQAATLRVKAITYQNNIYAGIMKQVDAGTLSGKKITDKLQKTQVDLDQTVQKAKAEIAEYPADLAKMVEDQNTVQGENKQLCQYRVDAIFRVFTLKGKIQVLKNKLASH